MAEKIKARCEIDLSPGTDRMPLIFKFLPNCVFASRDADCNIVR
jgi:hypothetical protein